MAPFPGISINLPLILSALAAKTSDLGSVSTTSPVATATSPVTAHVVTVTPSRPPLPVVSLWTSVTATSDPITHTTTSTTIVDGFRPSPHVNKRQDPITVSGTNTTMTSPTATCTSGGLLVECSSSPTETSSSTDTSSPTDIPGLPSFDNSVVSCYETTLSGLKIEKINELLNEACPSFASTGSGENSPKIVQIMADDANQVTFQLNFNFTGTNYGSSFSLSPEACTASFTYAMNHCNDQTGTLYQNGMANATQANIPLVFLYSVSDVSTKRGEHLEEDDVAAKSRRQDTQSPSSLSAVASGQSFTTTVIATGTVGASTTQTTFQTTLTTSLAPTEPPQPGPLSYNNTVYECQIALGGRVCCGTGRAASIRSIHSVSSQLCTLEGGGPPEGNVLMEVPQTNPSSRLALKPGKDAVENYHTTLCMSGFDIIAMACAATDTETQGGFYMAGGTTWVVDLEGTFLPPDPPVSSQTSSTTASSMSSTPSSSPTGDALSVLSDALLTYSTTTSTTAFSSEMPHKRNMPNGEAVSKPLDLRSPANFVTCDIHGPKASLVLLQEASDTFCSTMKNNQISQNGSVAHTYPIGDGEVKISARNKCNPEAINVSSCKASFGNVIADCSLGGVEGQGGTDSTDCFDFTMEIS